MSGLPAVMELNRERVRARALERFGPDRMVREHLEAYERVIAQRAGFERIA